MKKNAKLSLNKGTLTNLDNQKNVKAGMKMSLVGCQTENCPATLDDCASWARRCNN
jgi:SH3-like domain-containing protein